MQMYSSWTVKSKSGLCLLALIFAFLNHRLLRITVHSVGLIFNFALLILRSVENAKYSGLIFASLTRGLLRITIHLGLGSYLHS